MPKTVMQAALVSVLMFGCSGCGMFFGDEGLFRDRSQDYKKAPETPVISLPAGKSTETLHEIYVIPAIKEDLVLAGDFEVPRPAALVSGGIAEAVRIQKLGDQRWALVGVAPGQVWPQVRNFISATGMQVARVDARAGIIETAWHKPDDQALPSRYQFRMEQGVQRGTSELHVLQMSQGATDRDWPPQSEDLKQEAKMLRAVAQFLADSADSAPVSMLAEQGIKAGGKITLGEAPEGFTFIRLQLPSERAWASLARALDRSTFEITDRNRSDGLYYTRFLGPDPEEDEGFMSWLLNTEEEHPLAGQLFIVTMKDEDAQTVTIRLRLQDETATLEKRQEQELLALIKGNIN